MKGWSPKEELAAFCLGLGFEAEFPFCPGRKFRADWRKGNVLVEYEGGVFAGGDEAGHRAIGRFLGDIVKYNLAAIAGFRVIRVTAKDVQTGMAFDWIEQALAAEVPNE